MNNSDSQVLESGFVLIPLHEAGVVIEAIFSGK